MTVPEELSGRIELVLSGAKACGGALVPDTAYTLPGT